MTALVLQVMQRQASEWCAESVLRHLEVTVGSAKNRLTCCRPSLVGLHVCKTASLCSFSHSPELLCFIPVSPWPNDLTSVSLNCFISKSRDENSAQHIGLGGRAKSIKPAACLPRLVQSKCSVNVSCSTPSLFLHIHTASPISDSTGGYLCPLVRKWRWPYPLKVFLKLQAMNSQEIHEAGEQV